jgi:hypothetical protein
MFRIPSETYYLLDSSGEWEPFVIANCPAIRGDLVGLDACGTLNSVGEFTEVGSTTHRLPSPTFEPHGPLVQSSRNPKALQVKFVAANHREAFRQILQSIRFHPRSRQSCMQS